MAILLVESTILFCGYWFSDKITKGFHAAMSNGLQYYGKEPSMSSIVDDIQTTVSYFFEISPVGRKGLRLEARKSYTLGHILFMLRDFCFVKIPTFI